MAYLSVVNRVSGGGGGGYGGSGNPLPVAEEQKSQPVKAAEPGTTQEPSGTSEVALQEPAPVIQATPAPELSLVQAGAPAKAVAATSQTPGTSIFTLVMQGAAMVSVVLIVVFSVYTRYKKKE